MIGAPYTYLAGGLALIAALGGAYAYGRSDGRALERDARVKAEKALVAERDRRTTALAQADSTAATAEIERQTTTREIRHEVERIIDRPVYRNVCIDADGLRILDNATAAANGDNPRASTGDTATDSATSPSE